MVDAIPKGIVPHAQQWIFLYTCVIFRRNIEVIAFPVLLIVLLLSHNGDSSDLNDITCAKKGVIVLV